MPDNSFENFNQDWTIRSNTHKDLLYFFLEREKKMKKPFVINNYKSSKELFESIKNYLYNNVKILDEHVFVQPKKIEFHEKFGWVLSGVKSKSYLGKSIISGAVKINIGNCSYISGTANINGSNNLNIGNFTSIANGVEFFTSNINHPLTHVTTFNLHSNSRLIDDGKNIDLPNFQKEIKELEKKNSIEIGNDVWIGRDVLIMPGIKIPNGCVIGARSIVTKNLKPYGIYVGSPARLVKYRFNSEIIKKISKIGWWNWTFDKIKKNKDFFDLNLNNVKGELEDYIK